MYYLLLFQRLHERASMLCYVMLCYAYFAYLVHISLPFMSTTCRHNPTAVKANHRIQPYVVPVFRYIKKQNHTKINLKVLRMAVTYFGILKIRTKTSLI